MKTISAYVLGMFLSLAVVTSGSYVMASSPSHVITKGDEKGGDKNKKSCCKSKSGKECTTAEKEKCHSGKKSCCKSKEETKK